MNRDGRDRTKTLERATQALCGAAVPPGPPAEILATLNGLDGQVAPGGQAAPIKIKTRRFPMKRVMSIAAALVLFVGLTVAAYFAFEGGATVAFAEVRRQIEQAQTMSWHISMDISTELAPNAPTHMELDCYYKDPGRLREEMIVPGMPEKAIVTIDFQAGEILSLVPSEKQAVKVRIGQLPQALRDRNKDVVAEMKKMVQGNAEELGTKTVDGREVKGFRVKQNQQVMDVWVDPKTGTPVTVDMEIKGFGKMTMSDFVMGAPLDDSLFSLEVPEGYKLMNVAMPMGDLSEDDLVAGLRQMAEWNGGVFPDTLTPTPEFIKKLKAREAEFEGLSKEQAVQKAMAIVTPMVRMSQFIQLVKDLEYTGAGVAVGDAEKIICRYKLTDNVKSSGKGPYRVVYGDFRITDADE